MNIDELDAALRRLAGATAPPALETAEQSVLARISGERPIRQADMLGWSAMAAAGAMVFGLISGILPVAPGRQGAVLSPLTSASNLAPSTLLVGER